MKTSSHAPRSYTIAALVALIMLIAAVRLATYHRPFETDVMIYAVFGHEMLEGRSLYVDLWDHKPPAIYIVFALAELLMGYGRHTVFFLNVFVNALTLVGIYFASVWGVKSRAAGIWGAAFWAVLSGVMDVNASGVNAEMFISACNVWAFALLLRFDVRARPLAVGALLALATFIKPFVVITAVFFAVTHAAAPPASSGRVRAIKEVMMMALPGLAGWSLHFIYFAASGRLRAFWEAVVIYNRDYAGDPLSNLLAPLRGEAELLPDLLAPLALLTLASLALLAMGARHREAALLAAFVVVSWIEIALPGRFFTHYYQLWMPPLIVGAAWFIDMLAASEKIRMRHAAHIAGAVVLVLLTLPQLHWYELALSHNWEELFHAQKVAPKRAAANIAAEATARELDALLEPNETFYEWGSEPSLYFWSRRRPPAGVLSENHLLAGPLAEDLSARVLAKLEREPPEIFVVARWAEELPGAAHHPILELVRSRYRPLPAGMGRGAFSLYALRGGALDERPRANSR